MAGSLQVRPLLIAPSILSADPLAPRASIDALKGNFDRLHVDVMDGHFVPNLSYGPAIVKALRSRYPQAVLDVHLMVEPGEDFLDMFLETRPNCLTVHLETCRHLHRALSRIRESGVKAGVAINPATSVEMLDPTLHLCDLVLLMSVNPGFGGQKFIPETCEKALRLCRMRESRGLDFLIGMDGGLGSDNIGLARKCGVDAAVVGSAVFGAPDPAAAVARIRLAAMRAEL